MNKRIDDVRNGREDNYLLPFYWQHGGNQFEKIPEHIERIYQSGCRAFCVESRTHSDFCKDDWWHDMEIIINEAKKRGMKVWIFDDDHYPTGHAAGAVKAHPELRQIFLAEKHVDVIGPGKNMLLSIELENGEKLLGAYAFKRTGNDEECIGEPLDLNSGVRGKFLKFDLPEGCWRVFFYYETTRACVRPDYIDMLREESVKLLVDTVYEPHYAHFSDEFGKTIAGFFSDEPCFGNNWIGPHHIDLGYYNRRVGMPGLGLPWRDDIPEIMGRDIGVDVLPLLSGLWYDIGEKTPMLRHAYMDTVTKLYRDCFTRQLGDWCEAHGVQYIGHIIEDMNAHGRLVASGGHYFRSLDGQHMSGIDIVLHQIIPGMYDYIHTGWAFGSYLDPAFFDVSLAKLGASLAHVGTQMEGRAMCEVFGAYGWAEGTPTMKWLIDYLLVRGINRFIPHAFSPDFPDPDCPPHFGVNGLDPQFEGFTKIMNYTNKAAHLFEGLTHRADAAVLYHGDAEWMNYDGGAMLTDVPAKILFDEHIDFDIVPADCFIDGTGSRVFKACAKDGKLVIGRETYSVLVIPAAVLLPEKLEKALKDLEKEGVPVIRMAFDTKPEELVSMVDRHVNRDVVLRDRLPKLRAIHFYGDSEDVYMFANESVTETIDTLASLASVKENTECVIFDMLNDETVRLPVRNGELPVKLEPYQSFIAVFDKKGIPEDLPEFKAFNKCGDANIVFDVEKAPYTDMTAFEPLAKGVPPEKLQDVTASDDLIEFSGRYRYTGKFVSDETGGATGIDLGEAGVTTHMWLNGVDLGVRVCRPYRYDISSALRDGTNELTIEVSNTLANAVRDRFSQYLAIPASGLIGPLTWFKR
ncbi:MAG: glycosyl transferase family 2 [Clostridia bacterium]|nr:glycosyl transferase family 2 [Clostridia bacterium]